MRDAAYKQVHVFCTILVRIPFRLVPFPSSMATSRTSSLPSQTWNHTGIQLRWKIWILNMVHVYVSKGSDSSAEVSGSKEQIQEEKPVRARF